MTNWPWTHEHVHHAMVKCCSPYRLLTLFVLPFVWRTLFAGGQLVCIVLWRVPFVVSIGQGQRQGLEGVVAMTLDVWYMILGNAGSWSKVAAAIKPTWSSWRTTGLRWWHFDALWLLRFSGCCRLPDTHAQRVSEGAWGFFAAGSYWSGAQELWAAMVRSEYATATRDLEFFNSGSHLFGSKNGITISYFPSLGWGWLES